MEGFFVKIFKIGNMQAASAARSCGRAAKSLHSGCGLRDVQMRRATKRKTKHVGGWRIALVAVLLDMYAIDWFVPTLFKEIAYEDLQARIC